MKKVTMIVSAMGLSLGLATSVMADGSKIKGSILSNQATVKNSSNTAIGGFLGDAQANQGSVVVE